MTAVPTPPDHLFPDVLDVAEQTSHPCPLLFIAGRLDALLEDPHEIDEGIAAWPLSDRSPSCGVMRMPTVAPPWIRVPSMSLG